jgi:NAD(P)-dependent dehydrogenase (short-subunit alcohol dehydrogenase family)
MKIEGQTAIVTGGASGLGLATVERLAQHGALVVLLDLPSSDGEAIAEKLGETVRFIGVDITDDAALKRAVAAASEWGSLRIAVNCAGVSIRTPVLDADQSTIMQRYRRVLEVNLVGTFNVARLAANAIASLEPLGEERGVIVNTASVAAFDGITGQGAYSGSKGGVTAMTLPLARDLAPAAIRVVTIAPGIFDTPY